MQTVFLVILGQGLFVFFKLNNILHYKLWSQLRTIRNNQVKTQIFSIINTTRFQVYTIQTIHHTTSLLNKIVTIMRTLYNTTIEMTWTTDGTVQFIIQIIITITRHFQVWDPIGTMLMIRDHRHHQEQPIKQATPTCLINIEKQSYGRILMDVHL
jgi:hypothetical protein